MRIAFCSDQYLPMLSGLVDSLETLAQELRTQGHEVRIYAANMPGTVPSEHVFRFPAWAIPGTKGGAIFSLPFGAMRDIRNFKPDVIHTELFGGAGLFAWYAARKLRVPLVGTDHTFPADYLYGLNFPPFPYLARKYAAWYYGRCDVVTTPSRSLLEELRAYGMKKPGKIISNPVAHQFLPLANKLELKKKFDIAERAIAVFGRIAKEKNLDAALEVFAKISENSDAQLVFIGDGPYRAALEARTRSARVKFLGALRDRPLVEALNACDVLLITSTSENQPMTLLQAYACGLPIVAAQAGGLPDYVQSGVSGYVVPPSDINQFAERTL
ncbi:MAG TPA: glycosyltransferase, partial [Candidatus Paceibacterota bacterium]|nr:glycosyltransferase [Candidatus Paceibacterota bacterium]